MKNYVKKNRVKKNIDINKLATTLNVSPQIINDIENNIYIPDAIGALKLAKFLQVKVEDIFILEKSDYKKDPLST